jgi:hypothetical protein
MEFVKNNILSLIIMIILMIIMFETCGGGSTPTPPPVITVIRDTVYYYKDSTIYNNPQITETVPFPVDRITKEYLPDTNYDAMVKKYISLVDKYLATNVSLDSIRIDSIGYVRVLDSISKNILVSRSISYKFKYPVIKEITTNTITVPEEKKRQMYVGGGAFFSPYTTNNSLFGSNVYSKMTNINGSLLYKSKTDQIIGAGVQWNGKEINYGLSGYLKLSFRKNNK